MRQCLITVVLLFLGAAVLWPQAGPASPSSIQERQISVPSSQQPAVLCVPAPHNARMPLVLLFGGTLAGDDARQSEELLRSLALQLANAGIASLRYPDAATVVPPSVQIRDAIAALNYQVEGLSGGPEFVLGYGLGGALGAYVAEQHAVRGLILLAPATAPIEDRLAEEKRSTLERQHRPEEEIRQELASQNGILADIRAGKMPATRMFRGAPASYWADWMNRNPISETQKLNTPMLILQGGQDRLVSRDNYEKIQSALNPRTAEFRWFPDLNHFFVRADKPTENGVDTRVITTIVGWMERHAPDWHR